MILQSQIGDFYCLIPKHNAMDRRKKNMSECRCGRSPTGFCKGWHGLSKEEYEAKLKEHQESNKEE